MVVLLAMPVVVAVVFTHRVLRAAAPSNILIARLRDTRPRLRSAAVLAALGLALVAAAHVLTAAIAGGADACLNFAILVLLWDAIKFVLAASFVAASAGSALVHGAAKRIRQPTSGASGGSRLREACVARAAQRT